MWKVLTYLSKCHQHKFSLLNAWYHNGSIRMLYVCGSLISLVYYSHFPAGWQPQNYHVPVCRIFIIIIIITTLLLQAVQCFAVSSYQQLFLEPWYAIIRCFFPLPSCLQSLRLFFVILAKSSPISSLNLMSLLVIMPLISNILLIRVTRRASQLLTLLLGCTWSKFLAL